METAHPACPPVEVLEGVAAGRESPPEHAAHLAACPACRQALAQIREDNRFLLTFAVDGQLPRSVPAGEPAVVTIPGYEFVEEVHRGGQGIVYRAIQRSTRRDVAIKLMKQGPFATLADRARFEREIETLSRLNHPNIVAIRDAGIATGFQYFVMDYVDGAALDEALPGLGTRLADAAAEGARAGPDTSEVRAGLEIFIKVCDAVHAAHLRGIIHRDLKPSNIRVDPQGDPHVLDFGLAKSTLDDGDPSITHTGQFVGSLPWASPEQVEGSSSRIDLRTDVYALGAILFELLTGVVPFDVDSGLGDAVSSILHRPPPRPSSVVGGAGRSINDELDTIILKCLAKDRDRRYQTAGELARDLRRWLAGEAIEAKRDSAIYVLRKTLRRYRLRVAAALAFVLLLGVFSVVMSVLYRRSTRLEREAVGSAGRLVDLLAASSIEQGRMAGLLGDFDDAEALLWTELLAHRVPRGEPSWRLSAPPGSAEAYWALWELYRRYPCRSCLPADPPAVQSATVADDGASLWVVNLAGQVRRCGDDGRVLEAYTLDGRGSVGLPRIDSTGEHVIHFDGKQFRAWRRSLGGHAVFEFPADQRRALEACSAHPGGRRVAVVTGGIVQVYDIASKDLLAELAATTGPVVAIALSNDEQTVAGRDALGNLALWDISTGRLRAAAPSNLNRRIDLHPVGDLLFAPDDLRVADGWVDIPGRIWDIGVDPPRVIPLSDAPGEYRAQAFSPDGTQLAIGDYGGALSIFDAATGRRRLALPAHPERIRHVAYAPDGRSVWSCADQTLRQWELAPDAAVRVISVPGEHFHGVDIAPDGRTLAAGGSLGALVRMDAETRTPAAVNFGNAFTISCVAFDRDGARLAAATYGNQVFVWLARDWKKPSLVLEHPFRVSHLAFSPDGARLATAGDDGGVRLWRVADGSVMQQVSLPDRIPQVAFDPQGTRLALAVRDGSLRMWDFAAGEVALWSNPSDKPTRAVGFSPDGSWVASAGADRLVTIRDAATRQVVRALAGHNREIFSLAVHPAGLLVATGDAGGAIRLWNVETPRPLATLDGHAGAVMALRFAPDGRTLVSAGLDGSVRVWDLAYYGRHLAGNLEAHLPLLAPEARDEAAEAAWRAWARERITNGE